MKAILYLVLVTILIGSMSCKIERKKTTTVVRDCTGTYLHFNDKDYHVCNAELLTSYENGDKLIVTFKKVKECEARSNEIVCMMYHENEGWIEIKKILN